MKSAKKKKENDFAAFIAKLPRPDDVRMKGLRDLARQVFVDRNARGFPNHDRALIKNASRRPLRQAISHLRKAKRALLAGDIAIYEHMCARAVMYWYAAEVEFFRPYALRAGVQYVNLNYRAKGSNKTADKFAQPELTAEIQGRLERGEPYPVTRWCRIYKLSDRTVRRRIKAVEEKAAEEEAAKELAK